MAFLGVKPISSTPKRMQLKPVAPREGSLWFHQNPKKMSADALLAIPQAFFSLWALSLGLLIGSFLNVVIYRLPLGRSIVSPPSACVNCNSPLHWSLNIPVLSYLTLGGRCRYCGNHYSARYALIEMLCGGFFLACDFRFGLISWEFWKTATLFCLCLVVFFIDYDHWIIPDSVNAFGAALGLGFSFVTPIAAPEILRQTLDPAPHSALWSILGALFGLAFFWSISVVGLALAKQEAMGGGDVKFAVLIGAYLGPTGALCAFLGSFFLGALFAVPMLLLRKGGGKDPIPFGTFMAVAAVTVCFFGSDAILNVVDIGRLAPELY